MLGGPGEDDPLALLEGRGELVVHSMAYDSSGRAGVHVEVGEAAEIDELRDRALDA